MRSETPACRHTGGMEEDNSTPSSCVHYLTCGTSDNAYVLTIKLAVWVPSSMTPINLLWSEFMVQVLGRPNEHMLQISPCCVVSLIALARRRDEHPDGKYSMTCLLTAIYSRKYDTPAMSSCILVDSSAGTTPANRSQSLAKYQQKHSHADAQLTHTHTHAPPDRSVDGQRHT